MQNTENKVQKIFAQNMLRYINESPTAYHATVNAAKKLLENGFTEIFESDRWNLEKGGKYFLTRNQSSILAFEINSGNIPEKGFHIVGTHTDSPCFKIKPGNSTIAGDGYVKLNTEIYGSPILSTWFDRSLSVAGRVLTKTEEGVKSLIIDLIKPMLVIPNLCIHFQRGEETNSNYNKQKDLLPLLGFANTEKGSGDYLLNLLSTNMGVEPENILDYELFLYDCEDGILSGMNDEFISAGRLDDLSMVYSSLEAFINSKDSSHCKVFAAFDNEEVGSTTAYGANSSYLTDILKRICISLGHNEEDYFMALANSFAISADMAHAVHPNYGDKHDPKNRPVLGSGPVIKYSASQRYATNAYTSSFFIQLCKDTGVLYQQFANHSNIPGGSTIGPALSSRSSIQTVDVGTPLLAMHSIREFGCVADNLYAAKAFEAFYSL